MYKDVCKNNARSKKMVVVTEFGTKISWSNKCGSKQNVCSNKFWSKTFWVQTRFGSNKILIHKNCGSTKMSELQKDWVLKKFGPKTIGS